jgi:hypothetical protein
MMVDRRAHRHRLIVARRRLLRSGYHSMPGFGPRLKLLCAAVAAQGGDPKLRATALCSRIAGALGAFSSTECANRRPKFRMGGKCAKQARIGGPP